MMEPSTWTIKIPSTWEAMDVESLRKLIQRRIAELKYRFHDPVECLEAEAAPDPYAGMNRAERRKRGLTKHGYCTCGSGRKFKRCCGEKR